MQRSTFEDGCGWATTVSKESNELQRDIEARNQASWISCRFARILASTGSLEPGDNRSVVW